MFDFRFFFFNSTHNCPKFLLSDGPHTGSWRVKKELQEPRSTRGKEATVNAGNTDWERKWYNEYGLGQLLPQTYEMLKEQYAHQQRLKNKLDTSVLDNEERVVIAKKQPIRRKMLELE